ncbi:hypothetical protein EW146_g760 [Bondarzewia mesenterica]|uniref:Uncharacterized protein n=1 Tax=Bondarzewia mesenterica TaxID=1095465 RepID=A0A4V3XGA2_9AGAM|nr:hypothetical protein EW146_g760 [Bondarzewia mesenterica]
MRARALLDDVDLYLGDKDIQNKVAWYQGDDSSMLVLKSDTPDDEDEPQTAITLGYIGQIDADSYWLTSDANYTGQGHSVVVVVEIQTIMHDQKTPFGRPQ